MKDDSRAVVSGIGIITGFGNELEDFEESILNGQSSVRDLPWCRDAGLTSWLGAPSRWDPVDSLLPRRALKGLVRSEKMQLDAVARALKNAGLSNLDNDATRTGFFFAGEKRTGNLDPMLSALAKINDSETGAISEKDVGREMRSSLNPLFYVEGLQSLSLYNASRYWGVKGPNSYIHGSGDAGVSALKMAMRCVTRDEVDVAIVAAGSVGTSLASMARVDSMGLLTKNNVDGVKACKPYDLKHSGTVLGDGAVCLVVQRHEDAKRVHSKIVGVGLGSDETRAPRPDPEAKGITSAVRRAVRDSGREEILDDVTHIVGHGSGTPAGDQSEVNAISSLFERQRRTVRLTSVKPLTGHLSPAAGLVNIATSICALKNLKVPGVPNLITRDPKLIENVCTDGGEISGGSGLVISRGVEGQTGAVILDA